MSIARTAGQATPLRSRAGVSVLLAVLVATLLLGSSFDPSVKRVFFWPRFAAMGLLLIAALFLLRHRNVGHIERPYVTMIGALALLALASTAWSPFRTLTAERALSFCLMCAAIIGLASTWWSRREIRVDISVLTAVLGASMIPTVVLLVVHPAWAFVGLPDKPRLRGVFENPNTVGVVTCLVTPLAMALAIRSRGWQRTWWILITLTSFVAAFGAQSRAGLVALVVGLVAFAFQGRQLLRASGSAVRILMLAFGLVIFLGGVVLLLPLVPLLPGVHLNVLQHLTLQDSSGRTAAWALLIDLWKQRPVTGWGFGTTDQVFGPGTVAIAQVFEGSTAHDAYLQVLFELGPVGLILIVLAVVNALSTMVTPAVDYFDAGVLGACVAGAVDQLFESGLTSGGSIIAFDFWTLALAVLMIRRLSILEMVREPRLPSVAAIWARPSKQVTQPDLVSAQPRT